MKKPLLIFSVITFLSAVSFWLKDRDDTKAFNDAVNRGNELRHELTSYFNTFHKYPSNLSDLRMSNIPGKRWYGGTIILYKSHNDSYELSFSDKLIFWKASDKEEFMAYK